MTIDLIRSVAVAVALATSVSAQAQRTVIVNGEPLNASQIVQLERIACTRVPEGSYWVDPVSGAWGYAGNPTLMGYVGDACRQTRRPRSLSERGLLYGPGEILNGR